VIQIFISPNGLDVISRRIVVKHQSGLGRQEVTEIITLFNDGKEPIREFYFEMEDFRNELSVTDDKGFLIPFLTKEKIKRSVDNAISKKLDSDQIHICGIALPTSIESGEYRVLKLTYNFLCSGSGVYYYNSLIPFYKYANFLIFLSFFGNETLSLSLDFEEGITTEYGISLIARDNNNNRLYPDIQDKFHYTNKERNITLSISDRKRKEATIEEVAVLYVIVPDKEVRNIVGTITLFSILFPAFIVAEYFHFKSLSLFGIMATTELLSIVSLGIARFQSILISVNKRLIISSIELVLVFLLILIPNTWLLSFWHLLISHL
jgi:hypothetical protein